jgi:hypothetical protein
MFSLAASQSLFVTAAESLFIYTDMMNSFHFHYGGLEPPSCPPLDQGKYRPRCSGDKMLDPADFDATL